MTGVPDFRETAVEWRRASWRREAVMRVVAEPRRSVGLELVDARRLAQEMRAGRGMREADAQVWVAVTGRIAERWSDASAIRFLDAGEGTALQRMAARLAVLDELIGKLRGERG